MATITTSFIYAGGFNTTIPPTAYEPGGSPFAAQTITATDDLPDTSFTLGETIHLSNNPFGVTSAIYAGQLADGTGWIGTTAFGDFLFTDVASYPPFTFIPANTNSFATPPLEFVWDGSTFFGDFSTPTQWIPAGPPGANDVALYGNNSIGLYVVDITTNVTVGSNIVDATTTTPVFDILSGGKMTTGGFDFVTTAGLTIDSGGALDVLDALTATAANQINIVGDGAAGGILELANSSIGATIGTIASNITFNFQDTVPAGPNSGVIQFDTINTTAPSSGGLGTDQEIKNVAFGNEFVIGGQDFTGDTVSYSGSTLTVLDGGTTVFTMDNVSATAGDTQAFEIVGTNIIEAVCYARGTMIRTPDGELPVEKLRPGKRVITLVDGQEVPQTVTWLGHRRIDLTGHPRPETVAPIRILRGAFADNMPHRDLVVSPDHAVFVDGKLICARQLVNGATIRQERGWTAVDYYHLELDQHAILLAEGLPAESYIDTGNSGFFANSGAPMVLHPDLTDETGYPTREAGSCEPFVSDEAGVQPVWQQLADRAAAIGLPVPERATTTDSGLRLRSKRTGRRTYGPVYSDSNLVIFTVPSRSLEVQLLSRAQSPTEARPWLDDRRHLGVRVKRIVLRSANELREIPVDHPNLASGWWAVERDGEMMARWTDGEAVLPLPAMQGPVMLEIHLAGSMTYAVDAASEDGTGRLAAV